MHPLPPCMSSSLQFVWLSSVCLARVPTNTNEYNSSESCTCCWNRVVRAVQGLVRGRITVAHASIAPMRLQVAGEGKFSLFERLFDLNSQPFISAFSRPAPMLLSLARMSHTRRPCAPDCLSRQSLWGAIFLFDTLHDPCTLLNKNEIKMINEWNGKKK